MKKKILITHLVLDVGGVLLINGWGHYARKGAATKFKLKFSDIDDRHRLAFGIYEKGKLSLEEYLNLVVFYQKRPFTRDQFWHFTCAQSKLYSEIIELIKQLKVKYGLKLFVVSNEARELNAYRIRKFKLDGLVVSFISSCLVYFRKPDEEIFRLTLDIAQADAKKVIYIENTPMFVQIAEDLGIMSLLHAELLNVVN